MINFTNFPIRKKAYGFRLSSMGFVLLVGVSFCIKAIAQRHYRKVDILYLLQDVFFYILEKYSHEKIPFVENIHTKKFQLWKLFVGKISGNTDTSIIVFVNRCLIYSY